MTIFFAVILGLIIGSFLNAVIYRLSVKRSFLFGRSICPTCKHELSAWDLIPVLSFLMLSGKCHYCKQKISWQYPIVELATAVSFGFLAWNLESGIWNLVVQLIFACFLIVIGVYDYKHYLILDKVVYPAAVLALIWSIVNGQLVNSLFGSLIIVGFFGLQYLISSGKWIGLGDVKFGLFLGILFGFKLGLVVLMIAYVSGAAIGIVLIVLGRKKIGSPVPLGSLLAGSGIIVMVWGEAIASWYLKLIGL